MFLYEKTEKELGYSIDKIKSKKIYVRCDYCNTDFLKKKDVALNQRQKIDKDACIKCCYIKRREIELKLHNGVSAIQRPEVKEKIKKSNLKKYGVEFFVQSTEFEQKAKQTKLEKYGVEHVMQNPDHKDKVKQIMIEKYGVSTPLEKQEFREKVKKTMLDKYGQSNSMQIDKFIKKRKNTNISRYGQDNVFKLKKYQDKAIQTKISNGSIRIYQNKTILDWANENNYSYSHFCSLVNTHGFEQASQLINSSNGMTSIENKIAIMLDKNNIKYIQQFKVENRFADFYLPDYNLIIEANGNFWHSDYINKDKNYHQNKKLLYNKYNYKSLFFREDEINNKFEIVESIILNQCNKSNRIYARKCKIREISKKEGKIFLNTNHLMGGGSGRCFGLIYNNELVSLMRIRPYKKGYEISRFCHKIGTNIIGGFSKLLQKIISIFSSNIITFIDLRYGSGDYLTNIGFLESKTYLSFKWTNGEEVFNRMNYPSNSGYSKGLNKLWDCGQRKFEYASILL